MGFTVPSPVFRTLAQFAGSPDSLLVPAIWASCEGEKLYLTACNTLAAFQWYISSWRYEHDFYGIDSGWESLIPFPKDLHKVKTGTINVDMDNECFIISEARSNTRIYEYGAITEIDDCAKKVVQDVFPDVFSTLDPLFPTTIFPVNALCFNWKSLGFDPRANIPIGFEFLGQGNHNDKRSPLGPLVFGFDSVHYQGWWLSARYIVMPIARIAAEPLYGEEE